MELFRPTSLPIDPFGTPDVGFRSFRVTSPYGVRKDPLGQAATVFHGGLDLGNGRLGDDVIAAGPGEVILAGNQPKPPWNWPSPSNMVSVWGPSYGGNMVVIRHGSSGLFTQHAHLRDFEVEFGDKVTVTQIIGHVGESGSAHGAGHLHFGVRDNRKLGNGHDGFVDPWPLIQPTGGYEDPAVLAQLREENARLQLRIKALENRRDSLAAKVTELSGLDAAALKARLDELRELATAPIEEIP